VRVNFWASTNSQLQLGNFKVGTSSLMKTTSKHSDPAIAHLLMLTSTLPSPRMIIPSFESSSMESMFLLILCKFPSAPPTYRALSSRSRSQLAPRPSSDASGYLGLLSPQPLLPSVHMEDKYHKANILVQ